MRNILVVFAVVGCLAMVGRAQTTTTSITITVTTEQLAALDSVLNEIAPAVRLRWVQAKVDDALALLVARAREQRRAAIIDVMTAEDDAVRATAVEVVKALKDKTWTCAQAEVALKRKLPCSGGGE